MWILSHSLSFVAAKKNQTGFGCRVSDATLVLDEVRVPLQKQCKAISVVTKQNKKKKNKIDQVVLTGGGFGDAFPGLTDAGGCVFAWARDAFDRTLVA